MNSRALFAVMALSVVLLAVNFATAAPHDGEEFALRQPDGSEVRVLVWGDEFYQTVESPDGYTLVRDADGWITYAQLSADGSEYVSTGVRYTGPQTRAPALQKRLRISRESFEKKHRSNREALGYDNDAMIPEDRRRGAAAPGFAPAPGDEPTNWVGLTVLINFPGGTNPRTGQTNAAVSSNVTRQSMEDFANRVGGYNGSTASGSVRDYFWDVSNATLDYSNIVADFVTVAYPKNYYDTLTNYQFVPELIQSALNEIKKRVEANQLDISHLSTEGSNNTAVALNIMYAGSASQGWSNGIWPHQGTYRAPGNTSQSVVNGAVPGGTLTINVPATNGSGPAAGKNIRFSRYQLASLGTGNSPPGIGTFVHENGHMIMRWPDLYNYDNTVTNVVASYCVMSSSNGSNPQQPNPMFRAQAGWINVTDITNMNAVLTHTANVAHNVVTAPLSTPEEAYYFRRNNNEGYYIEARRRVGRSANIPGEGLIIWHTHASGVNTALNSTNPFPRVKVVQANLATSTTVAFPAAPTANAPFRAGGGSNNTEFHSTSSPPARYYDGTNSPIRITEVSQLGATMSFRIGSAVSGPPTYLLDVVNGTTGTGLYPADTTVRIGALPTNAAGRGFVRWSADTDAPALIPANIYACTTTVRTVARNVSVTANYGRVVSMPGMFEADTFGFAGGITSQSSANASGGRVARGTAAGNFAEYVVDVAAAGDYHFSYRVAGASGNTSPGRFVLKDVTNNIVFDTVIIPTGGTALRTVEGKTAALGAGRSVWRLEIIAAAGNINIDWIQADNGERRYDLTVTGGTGSGSYIADTTVTIAAPPANAAGRSFMRWNDADTATLSRIADIYACTTTVTTRAASSSVASVYARAFVLPGYIEADTFGLAQGFPGSQNITGTSGGRAARVRDSSVFAEYVVDIQDDGIYKLSYGIQTGTATAGVFRIRDMTNGGVTIDSVAVPTSTSTRMQAVEGKGVFLSKGKAVWRFEPLGGNYAIDTIGAEFMRSSPVRTAAARAPLTYDLRAAPSGNIKFAVPSSEHVSLRMYDIKGRMVAVLHDGVRNPGIYNVSISSRAGGIAQGMYIVRMRSGSYSKDVRVNYRR
ncbi:MAG: M6 family metalloprotease domain-containing protein [Chitinispirillia bacterium]|nr:M6 family metalloprotease domain-containing protein [Chitinispirillia bacterium]